MLLLVSMFTYEISQCHCKNNIIPSKDNIIKWYQDYMDEHISSLSMKGVKKVFLYNKEEAFVSTVTIEPRGIPFMNSTILIIPEKKQAREIYHEDGTRMFNDIINIYDLDHDGISEIEFSLWSMAQGEESEYRYLVQFDGWKPIILHEAEMYGNSACCSQTKEEAGNCGECKFQNVLWKFNDLDGDGVDDLIEETTTQKGPNPDKLTTTKTTAYYLFKNKKFIKVDDPSKLHLPQ